MPRPALRLQRILQPNPTRLLLLWLMALSVFAPVPGQACTTFVLKDGSTVLFARNLDWFWGDGYLAVNPRGISKTAFVLPPETPVRWVSKYGSVTFNQFSLEMPLGGMNEKGLVIENMMLPESKYAPRDDRAAINLVQWIQYHLDTCATLDEVLRRSSEVRIEPPFANASLHYLVSDATGAAATIEMLDGKLVCHHGPDLPIPALANSTYASSREFAKTQEGPGGHQPALDPHDSLMRFSRAAQCVSRFTSKSPEADRAFAFQSLESVDQDRFTVWSIVYDPVRRRIDYRTRENRAIRWLQLADLDFSPKSHRLHLDVQTGDPGDIRSRLSELSPEQHRQHLTEFVARPDVRKIVGDLRPMVDPMLSILATYRAVE